MSGHTLWSKIRHKKDRKWYRAEVYFGPCHADEAEVLMEKIADYVYDLHVNYGACVSMAEAEPAE